jgi:hypothetical protein
MHPRQKVARFANVSNNNYYPTPGAEQLKQRADTSFPEERRCRTSEQQAHY